MHVELDDDEAEYLEGILENKRKEEANVKKETREQLEIFRRQQEDAERKALEEDNEAPQEDQVQWAAPARKRKKGPETSLLKGVKLRKSSSAAEKKKSEGLTDDKEKPMVAAQEGATSAAPAESISAPLVLPSAKAPAALSLGLGYASSDDDD